LRFLLSEDGGKSPFARKTRGRGAAKEGKKEGIVYPQNHADLPQVWAEGLPL
jgi:hypothetical protein